MDDGTAVLFGPEGEFCVLQVDRVGPRVVRVVIAVSVPKGACPACGVVSTRVKDRPLVRVKVLPVAGQGARRFGGGSGACVAVKHVARE